MNTKARTLLILTAAIIVLIATWYFRIQQINMHISQVSIVTDRQEYHVRETVHISIQNWGTHPIDIYCPGWCALGNFPTRVEHLANGQWEYFAGFCPSIEPLLGSGVPKGNYIQHTLLAKQTFELDISNFESLHLQQEEKLRIVYYLGATKVPIYSNEFSVKP